MLLVGYVFSISFVSRTALACIDPDPPEPPPPIRILIKCHGDGTVWIIINNLPTFSSAGDMSCGCSLTLAPELGDLTGATLEVDGQTVMNFTPNSNTRLEGGGELQQGLATPDPVTVKAGLLGKLMLHVEIPPGQSYSSVRRAINNSTFNAGTATLNWSAASEGDVIGYRLYRGKLVDIEDVVGEMIPNKWGRPYRRCLHLSR